jgi:hypothetical protein
MKPANLSEYFAAVAAKRLSAVETGPAASNQHEFNGVNELRRIFGSEKQTIPATFIHLGEGEDVCEEGFVTWYDSRADHPTRTEYRLYYNTTVASEKLAPGDLLVIARTTGDRLLVITSDGGSTTENQLLWLFGLPSPEGTFAIRELGGEKERIGLIKGMILETMGIEVEEEDGNLLELLLKTFGDAFPRTSEFSTFARDTRKDVRELDDPDAALMSWMEQEELLFRTLERHIVSARLMEGFGTEKPDVDAFISFSLSVQNRRKARVGYALENHIEHIIRSHGIRYARGKETENHSRPDFVFPGIEEYRDKGFPSERLSLLGVKSTCKDRWRQVLAEGARIGNKHLLTFEAGISESQTAQMQAGQLALVVPVPIQNSYSARQRDWLLSVKDFLAVAKDRQSRN